MVDVNAAVLIGFFLSDFDNTLKLLPCMLRDMKKADNDNEQFSFITLLAATRNVVEYLGVHQIPKKIAGVPHKGANVEPNIELLRGIVPKDRGVAERPAGEDEVKHRLHPHKEQHEPNAHDGNAGGTGESDNREDRREVDHPLNKQRTLKDDGLKSA